MYFTAKHSYFRYFNDNQFIIGLGSNQEIISNGDLFEKTIKLCDYCINGKNWKDISTFLYKESIDNKLFSNLVKKGFLVKKEVNLDSRYSRNHLYYQLLGYDYEILQDNIKNSHILVVGAGGIGNIVTYLMTTLGVNKISIVDDDTIELSNLNRQFLFREEDIGEFKVNVIKKELLKIRKDISIHIYNNKLSYTILDKIDSDVTLVISSADDPYCREMINEFCCNNKIPLINAGYVNDISVIGPFYIPNCNCCCLCCDNKVNPCKQKNEEIIERISKNYKAPSMLTNNFFTGALLSSELIKFFAQDYINMESINNMIGIHNKTFKFEKLNLNKNLKCKYCGTI